jgi:hypothetical protein
MDTLLDAFKDAFLRFALICATVKSFIFWMFALHTSALPIIIFFNDLKNNLPYVKYEKNRHATCLIFYGYG